MADILLPMGGGGGGASDECTAIRSHVLAGYTAVTADSNDEPVEGLIQSMGGRTITPSSAAQTVSCSGKYMTGNITVGTVSVYREMNLKVASSSVTEVFQGRSLYYVQYSGNIGFTPQFIMATNNDNATFHANFCRRMGATWVAGGYGEYAPYMSIGGNIYANSSGFKIPIGNNNAYCRNVYWVVYLYGY